MQWAQMALLAGVLGRGAAAFSREGAALGYLTAISSHNTQFAKVAAREGVLAMR